MIREFFFTVGTGDVCIYVYTEYEDETEKFIRGDVNRGGKVHAVDLTLLKQLLPGSTGNGNDKMFLSQMQDAVSGAKVS